MIGFVFNLGMGELVLILLILLLLFGARRLPELAQGLGQSIRAFKQGTTQSQLENKPTSAIPTESKNRETQT